MRAHTSVIAVSFHRLFRRQVTSQQSLLPLPRDEQMESGVFGTVELA
jgi:hypothetical protein